MLDPQWSFRFAQMEPLNHPGVFACLGTAIGIYGLLYWTIACRPADGWMIAAVGLLG